MTTQFDVFCYLFMLQRYGEMDWFSKAEIYSPLSIYFFVTLYVESNYRCRGITPYCLFYQRYLDNKMHLIYFQCPLLDLYLATIYCSSIASIFTMASVSVRFCITDEGIMNTMTFFFDIKTLPHITIKRNNTNVKIYFDGFPFKQILIILFLMMSSFCFLLCGII